ncbi:hypothetical protein CDQ84_15785 [Clostridium thermosuccinogenes]|uniref:DUF2680 domain-containing protein n=1 Tax=Clostridium thermosuccinogenes TaxID=84032 RepID=A0A2K2F8X4_9CLOT|nr:hypothetical protein [Pseudoclostridium thermosuccinogenes]AUS97396.1 hypothetical protein CDO33_13670 [Pseudoclostridium thermosuccinogenes]PNT95230.1 hypothetical protein CDQ85_15645 [Pseudoclostridium thermosuccinogenes]PNT96142.1 hypothetical protein CDQ84_15785 [Pseudoclostridium thermosuccinogenes]
MKRKIMGILTVVLVVAALSTSAVFAKDNGDQREKSAINSMFDAMRNWSQQAQERGEITEEEAKEWEKHFEDMKKFHESNGFGGHCGGFNNDSGNAENQNYLPRNSMMRRFSSNSI